MESLAGLVEEAYRLFAGYEMGDELGVCTDCCVNDANARLLKTLKPQEMSCELILQFLDAVAYQDRPCLIPQMKHLMPRILQLLVQDEYISHCTEITLRNCSCKSVVWSTQEIAFMQRFALAYFAKQFKGYGPAADAQDILVMFHVSELDVTPLLDYWREQIANPIVLWGAVELVEPSIRQGYFYFGNSWSDDELCRVVEQWISRGETRAAMIAAISECIDVLKAASLPVWKCEAVFDWL